MTVLINGVADQIPKSLLTTTGDIIGASAVSTPARIAAPASGLVLTGQGVGVLPAYAVAATGAVTRAGGNTTEATTTSTSAVDLLSATGLSITTGVPVSLLVALRKTTGAAAYASLGLKLNATITGEASAGIAMVATTGDTDTVQSRYATAWLGPRITNYNLKSSGFGVSSGVVDTANAVGTSPTQAAAQPIATITNVIMRGITGSAAVTCGADELHVFSYATS